MASVTLCLLFIKKVHGWQGFFKYWYSIQINTQKLHALHLYAKIAYHNLAQIFTHLCTLPFLPTLAIYIMSYCIKTFLIV